MSVICVTGQMAAGKNYICSRYEKEGWISVDADKVVHEAVEACKDEIIGTFGDIAKAKGVELLGTDGKIIRRNLGSLIFGDAELLKKQEEIVYPYVTEYFKRFIGENRTAPNSLNTGINKIMFPNSQNAESNETAVPNNLSGVETKSRNIIINATVLYKTPELLKLCEKIVYVKSPFFKRLIRARRRDRLPYAKILSRFRSQKGLLGKYKESGIPVEIIKN